MERVMGIEASLRSVALQPFRIFCPFCSAFGEPQKMDEVRFPIN